MQQIEGRNGGKLIMREKGDPALPRAGRPANPFRDAIRSLSEDDTRFFTRGRLVLDGVVQDEVVDVAIDIPGAQAIVLKAIRQARKGNAQARKWLTDTGWGKMFDIMGEEEGGTSFVVVLPPNGR